MSIKLADTLKPMGDFPAAESSDIEITVADGTKKSLQKAYIDGDLGGEGTNIQVTEMPYPNSSYYGKIYQYIGPTVLNNNEVEYINGFFYKCVISGGNYKWELCDVSKTKTIRTVSTLPTSDIEDAIYAKTERKFTSFPTHQFVPGEDSNQSVQLMRDWLNSLRGFGFREDYDSETDQYVFRSIKRTLFLFHPTLKTYCAVIALMVHKSLNVMSYWIVSPSGGSSSSQAGDFNQYDTYSFRIEYYSKQYYGGEYNTQDITPLPGITGVSDVDELPESGTIGDGIYRIRDGEVKNILCTGTFEDIKQRLIEAGFTVSDTTDPEIGIFYYQITPPGPIDVYIPDAGWFWSGQYYKLILSNTNPASVRFHTDRNTHYGIGGLDDNKNLTYRDSRKKSCYIGDSEFQKLDELGGGGVKIFYGTDEEWNALSVDEKKEYDYKAGGESDYDKLSNEATLGDMKPITSNGAAKLLCGSKSNPYDDCNEIVKVGTYTMSPTISNRPLNVDYGVLMVFGHNTNIASGSSQWIYQYFYETNSIGGAPGRVYRRSCTNPDTLTPSSAQWTSWEIIAGGVEFISNPFTVNTDRASSAAEISAIKQNRTVQFKVYIESLKNIASDAWNTLGTVPDVIKPAVETVLTISDGRVVSHTTLARIIPSGEVQIWGDSDLNSLSSRFSATYFTAN